MKMCIKPTDLPCCLADCPPGLFLYKDILGFKTEYSDTEVYCADSGEIFWGGEHTDESRQKLQVLPCISAIVSED